MIGLSVLAAMGGIAVARGVVGAKEVAAFLCAYLFSSALLSPDLDLAHSHATRRWGPLRVLWLPYAWAFRHRRTSHRPILGPLSRIGYLGLWVVAVTLVVAGIRGEGMRLAWPGMRAVAAIVGGLYLPNLLHIGLDRLDAVRRGRRRG
jgi:uncharacterized metal-binding protein